MKLFGIGSKLIYPRDGAEYTCTGFVKIMGEWHVRLMNDENDFLFTLTEIETYF